jgi:SAM-dependent methyltransferase
MPKLIYQPMEYISIVKPVDRIRYIESVCRGKRVLDLGCWDETALSKIETPFWLHSRIASVASDVIGIDNSSAISAEGIRFKNSIIYKGDITDRTIISGYDIDIIVAGELIEHLPNTMAFFEMLKATYPGKQLLCTTPNATSISNIILGIFSRESTHRDHLSIYSYKTLTSLCERAGFTEYQIRPYFVKYTELILRQKGIRRSSAQFIERLINSLEYFTPILAGGYVLDVII